MLSVVDVHCGGENARVVTGGLGDVPGETMLDKRAYLTEHRDELRLRLLQEPRGGVIHSADFVLPSNHPEARLGYVVAESTEHPVMSGSNTICVTTALLETGMLPMTEPVTHLALESAAGLVRLERACADGEVTSVRFTNQPAFVHHLDAAEQLPAVHPEHPELPGITNLAWTGPLGRTDAGERTARNAVVVSPGRIDRSPCGTGTSDRLAVLHARGLVAPGENFVHTSLIRSRFDSRAEALTTVGGVPSVAGQAWITQLCQVGVDPGDPFPQGCTLGDTWGASPPSELAARLVAAAAGGTRP